MREDLGNDATLKRAYQSPHETVYTVQPALERASTSNPGASNQ